MLNKLMLNKLMLNKLMCNKWLKTLLGVWLVLVTAIADGKPMLPVAGAHAHNDYLHQRPLFDALDQGFNSVEADIFLVKGELWVAHRWFNLDSDRTLQGLYLDPLLARVNQNSGRVYRGAPAFTLLIDIKTNGKETYKALAKLLENYAPMLTTVSNGQASQGAVTVIVSGHRPKQLIESQTTFFAGYDGRLTDLESDIAPYFMPMISDKWTSHFDWRGVGIMPHEQRLKLRHIVKQAHQKGRVVRFWATPEQPALWHELRAAGVDLINTDRLADLARFLSGG